MESPVISLGKKNWNISSSRVMPSYKLPATLLKYKREHKEGSALIAEEVSLPFLQGGILKNELFRAVEGDIPPVQLHNILDTQAVGDTKQNTPMAKYSLANTAKRVTSPHSVISLQKKHLFRTRT